MFNKNMFVDFILPVMSEFQDKYGGKKGTNKASKEKMANLVDKYKEHSESRKDQRKILT